MFNNLPDQLFSPAKISYISYIVLSIFRETSFVWWQFVFISLFFIVIEIGHNDYFRIILNNSANKNSKK